MHKSNNLITKILVAVSYVAMVTVNYLANALPIGGVTTGQASDSYPNLFTPAGVTFSIWGVIYLLLAVYVVYQFGWFGENFDQKKEALITKVGQLFILTSVANISWIFAWHYGVIWLSVTIMVILLVALIMLADVINKKEFSLTEKICLRLPFSIYFGWITVATIANISVFLVSINWDGFGIAESIWTIIVLLVGAAIGIIRGIKDRNISYLAVFIWAYGGILLKHTSAEGFAGGYPNIITTLFVCLALFLGTIGWITFKDMIYGKPKN